MTSFKDPIMLVKSKVLQFIGVPESLHEQHRHNHQISANIISQLDAKFAEASNQMRDSDGRLERSDTQ